MKHNIFKGLLACGAMLALAGCSENAWNDEYLDGFEVVVDVTIKGGVDVAYLEAIACIEVKLLSPRYLPEFVDVDGLCAERASAYIEVAVVTGAHHPPVRWLSIEGMLSWGDWIWDSNAQGYFYNELGQPIQNLTTGDIADGIGAENHLHSTLNQKGVKVGPLRSIHLVQ